MTVAGGKLNTGLLRNAGLTLIVVLLMGSHIYGTEATPTLTGHWIGTWSDSRPDYAGGGGDFSCDAVEMSPGKWAATFALGKSKTFHVELTGVRAGETIAVNTSADLGKFYGVYLLTGNITRTTFTATYSGKDERGTFSLRRDPAHTETSK